jgi:hypothetical protein
VEQPYSDQPPESIVPLDFYGMTADEIVEVHRNVYGTDELPPAVVDLKSSLMDAPQEVDEAFEDRFEKLCKEHPAEATEVLVTLSLSEDYVEKLHAVIYVDALLRGNVAAGIALLADAISSTNTLHASDGWEVVEKAEELGLLDVDQALYLFRIYENNPFRLGGPLG